MSSNSRLPKYRHYQPKNLAVVRVAGKDHYLGRYDSPESWEKYHRLLAEQFAKPAAPGLAADKARDLGREATVEHVLLAFWKHAEDYYVRDGKPTKELASFRDALRPLRLLFGTSRAADFGPLALKAVRSHMVDVQKLCRTLINRRIGRIKRVFNWAVSEELIPAAVAHGLVTVKGLTRGRTAARESEPVKPVPDAWVDAVLPFVPPQLAAMVEVQRRTGMRPGEVVIMRLCDLDRSRDDVWIYCPERHKNDWRGHVRLVALGPQAQAVLRPFLDRDSEAYLFSPREAQQWRLANRPVHLKPQRTTPIYPSELLAREKAKELRRTRQTRRVIGDHYTTETYWKALTYGFKRAHQAGVEVQAWSPHQLRHSRATELRKKFGIEATRVSLGHARLEATEIYAEKDLMLAIEVAREAG